MTAMGTFRLQAILLGRDSTPGQPLLEGREIGEQGQLGTCSASVPCCNIIVGNEETIQELNGCVEGHDNSGSPEHNARMLKLINSSVQKLTAAVYVPIVYRS